MPKKRTGSKPVTNTVSLAIITADTKEANISIFTARLSGWSAVVPRIHTNFFCVRG